MFTKAKLKIDTITVLSMIMLLVVVFSFSQSFAQDVRPVVSAKYIERLEKKHEQLSIFPDSDPGIYDLSLTSFKLNRDEAGKSQSAVALQFPGRSIAEPNSNITALGAATSMAPVKPKPALEEVKSEIEKRSTSDIR